MAVLNIIGGFGFLGYVLPYILYQRDENETKGLIMPRMCIPGSSDFYILVFYNRDVDLKESRIFPISPPPPQKKF